MDMNVTFKLKVRSRMFHLMTRARGRIHVARSTLPDHFRAGDALNTVCCALPPSVADVHIFLRGRYRFRPHERCYRPSCIVGTDTGTEQVVE